MMLRKVNLGSNLTLLFWANKITQNEKNAREVVIKVLKKMVAVGNSCLKRNANVLLCKLRTNKDILCPGERIPEGKFSLTY